MNRYIMDEYFRIPDLHTRMDLAARRERSRAIAAAFAWLWQFAKSHLTPRIRLRPSRWIARLG